MEDYKFKATIKYDCDSNHPDAPGERGLEYTNTYTFHPNFWGYGEPEEMRLHMMHDLALIAGGGYTTDNIKNIKFVIKEL